MSQAPSPSRSQRAPGIINAVVAIVVLVLVAVLALRASQASPPPIAEYAPQVQQTIQQAPQEQTNIFGNGNGGAGSGTPTPTPTPPPTPGATPGLAPGTVVNPCVGDPPRQIEDPQSPPCIAFYNGPNGGATSMGVTQSTITLQTDDPKAADTPSVAMVNFFNSRFEMYHRHIVLQYLPPNDKNTGSDAASQRALADDEVALNHPFAAGQTENGSGISYADEMAKDKVIDVMTRPFFSEGFMASRAPYLWSYPMAQDTLQRTFAAWACSRVPAGSIAAHAGAGSLGSPRKFGLVFTTEAIDIPNDTSAFTQALSACGISVDAAPPVTGNDSSAQAQQAFESTIIKFKTDHVTSVFYLGDRGQLSYLQQDADAQAYQPEWLITNYDLFDNANISALGGPADQKLHMFGIRAQPMERQCQDIPMEWADPSTCTSGNPQEVDPNLAESYHSLLLLASGIQMAGPNLTPSSFQSGLQQTTFPNPNHPIMAGKVGFAGGSHAMTIDAAEWWWSNTDVSPNPATKNPGTFCYVAHGARHSLADPWPAGDPWFQQPCDSGNEPAG